MDKLYTYYNSDAAISNRIEQSFTMKMDKEGKEFEHFLEMLNKTELELSSKTTLEQAKEKYLEQVAPTKMNEAKSENKKAGTGRRILGGFLGSLAGVLLSGTLGQNATGPLAAKGANKLNTLIANRRKKDEENTQEAQNTL